MKLETVVFVKQPPVNGKEQTYTWKSMNVEVERHEHSGTELSFDGGTTWIPVASLLRLITSVLDEVQA